MSVNDEMSYRQEFDRAIIARAKPLLETDPNGVPQHAPGAKLDAGKPWTATVIRGWWPLLRDRYSHLDVFEEVDRFFGNPAECASVAVLDYWRDDLESMLDGPIQVGTFGAQKYTRHGWLSVADSLERYDEAAGRHYWALLQGELLAPDSDLPHAWHARWNVVACSVLRRKGRKLVD